MPTLPRDAGWLLIVVYVLGLILLMTVGQKEGALTETPFLLIIACGVLLSIQFGRLVAKRPFHHDSSRPMLSLALVALTLFVVATFADARLLLDAEKPPRFIHITNAGQVVLLASYLPAILRGVPERRLWREVRFGLFALFVLFGGASVMFLSPHAHGGAFASQIHAVEALLRGANPYHDAPPFTPPPTKLAAIALAFLAGRDVRWAPLAALLATGFAMRAIARRGMRPRVSQLSSRAAAEATTGRGLQAGAPWLHRSARPSVSEVRLASALPFPGLAEDAPALMLWLTPKAYFFIEQSYADILPVTFIAFALVAHARAARYAPAIFLGLALSAKQSMVWLLPLAMLLGFGAAQWFAFLATATIALVPFVIWDVRAAARIFLDLYGSQPATTLDGVAPTSWFYHRYGLSPRAAPGLVAAAVLTAISAWRAPRTRHAFCLCATVTLFAFWVFGRSTFIGSYYFLIAMTALTAAVAIGERFELG